MTDLSKAKWHEISSTTAKNLTDQTATPGLVYPVASNAIPDQLKSIKGIKDFYVSSYAAPIPITPGISAGGEIAAVRHDGEIAKAYNFIFATSSNALVYYSVHTKTSHPTTSPPRPPFPSKAYLDIHLQKGRREP